MAPCGIDCNDCNLYRADFEAERAEALVPWFREMGWIGADEGSAAVMAKAPFCAGCLGDRAVQWSENCEIRACCVDQRGLAHCGACADFTCRALSEFEASAGHHAAAVERLRVMRGGEPQ
jgi:hypothetical protein